MRHKPDNISGFTLIEFMLTLTIVGILMAIAMPSFISTIESNQTTTIANELVTALNLARSEAIKRGIQVTVKRKNTTPQVWESGWDVFTDKDGDGLMDTADNPPDQLLRTKEALANSRTLRTGGNFANWMAFMATGYSRGSTGLANDTFRLCDSSGDRTKSRAIKVNRVGRVITQTGTITCP